MVAPPSAIQTTAVERRFLSRKVATDGQGFSFQNCQIVGSLAGGVFIAIGFSIFSPTMSPAAASARTSAKVCR